MENFGIFCLFVVMIGSLISLSHVIVRLVTDGGENEGNAAIVLILVCLVDLAFLFNIFHKGMVR